MIFDTHAHYDDEAFNEDRESVIAGLRDYGVEKVVNVGARLKGSENSVELAKRYPFFYAAVGIHPDDCLLMDESWIERLRELASYEKCVAIGEIGLDYHGFDIYDDKPSKELQAKWFKRQLELAAEIGKTVIVHSRNAALDTLEMMKHARYELGIEKAIIHCFSYSQETAREYLEMGYYLGFGGVVTYEAQRKLTKVLGITPLERIVLETDCPYLAPTPHRGERNHSGYLTLVRDKLAEIKGVSPEEVESVTYENALKVYNINDKM
ncbi:MAG: TatD family hydrolase [Eubacteriales bacterium]|nr:TatD family hydrolase [Eubacteriales bacterium]